jgi:xanthine dehydrogenase YagR molybdenum-binding subunit
MTSLRYVRVPKLATSRGHRQKTARSHILGGVVMGIGMALHEEAMIDHRLGKIMNHNLDRISRPGACRYS